MAEHVNGWNLAKKIKSNYKTYPKHLSKVKNNCMIDYPRPSLQDDFDHFVLHLRTNDFN